MIRHQRHGSAVSDTVTYRIECDRCPTGHVTGPDGNPLELTTAVATARTVADHHCHGHHPNPRCTHNQKAQR